MLAVVLSVVATTLAILYIGAALYYFYNVRNGRVVYSEDLTVMFWGGLFLLFLLIALMIGSLVSSATQSRTSKTVVKTDLPTSDGVSNTLLIPDP